MTSGLAKAASHGCASAEGCGDLRSPPFRVVEQGEFAVSGVAGEELRALLGSCVSICLHDPILKVGGMTHTVFFDVDHLGAAVPLNEFEMLFNALQKYGVRRSRLRAAVVGGAHMFDRRRNPGVDLGEVTLAILRREGIAVDEIALGGRRARKMRFIPFSGELLVEPVAEAPREDRRLVRPAESKVELF